MADSLCIPPTTFTVAQEEEVVTAPATAPTPTRRRKSSIAMNVVELPTVKEEEVEPVSISVMEPLVEQEEPVAANGIVSGEASPDKLVSSISRRDSMRRQASRRVSFAADINALPKSEGESNADDELMPKRKSSGRMSIAEPTAFEEVGEVEEFSTQCHFQTNL